MHADQAQLSLPIYRTLRLASSIHPILSFQHHIYHQFFKSSPRMQMFRPSNDCYDQSYNNQSSFKPFFGVKPAIGFGGGNNLTQCQTQTQCFDAQLPGSDFGYGMQQHAAGAQGYGLQKPCGQSQYGQHGSYGLVQHGGHGGATHHQSSYEMMQGGGGYGGSTQYHASHATMTQHGSYGTGHQQGGFGLNHGSCYGSVCEGQSGGYSKYSMKKRERRWGRTRSGNDSDSSCSDESDHDN